MYDSKQKRQELHTSERTIVPRTVIFFLISYCIIAFQAGKNLWNNMVEPVDQRTSTYNVNELSIKCPAEGDFISTTQ